MDTNQSRTIALPGNTGAIWRLRVELADRPGAMARLTSRLADRQCNVLALSVLPVPGGVVDDIVVSVPPGTMPADLIAVVQGTGGKCVGISRTDRHDLVDAPTAALRTAAATVGMDTGPAEALRALLSADSVTPADAGAPAPQHPDADLPENLHEATIAVPGGTLRARRGWAPFTAVELARAAALVELLERAGTPGTNTSALVTEDGAGLVLRPALPADEQAIAELHRALAVGDLVGRYRDGARTVRGSDVLRLLHPPKGRSTLVVCGNRAVAMGRLLSTGRPEVAELALLVDPEWQRRGVGTALLRHLVAMAGGAGITELYSENPPERTALARTVARVGLAVSTRWDGPGGATRMSVSLRRTDGSGRLVRHGSVPAQPRSG